MFNMCQAALIGVAALTSVLPMMPPDRERLERVPANVSLVTATQHISIAGSSCRLVGQIRTTSQGSFKCVSIAKRKVWKRTPSSSTTSTSTTSTTLPKPSDDTARKVYELAIGLMSQDVADSTKLEYISEAPPDVEGEDAAKMGVAPALRLFGQLGFQPPNSVIIFFAKTESGVRSTLIEQGCDSPLLRNNSFEYLRSTGVAVGGSCGNNRVAIVASSVSRWSRDRTSIDFQHTIPHELFHTWQLKDSGMCGGRRCGGGDFPVWLWEGSPQFMTRLAFWTWNQRRTHDQWFDHWYNVERRDQLSMCKDVKIEQMVQPSPSWPSPGACAYSKGQLAIEVLVANYGGFDALKRLHTTRSTRGLADFAVHFRNSTGRDLAEFYAEVNTYFATRGMP